MRLGISIKIDVTKIDKKKLFHSDKTGSTYLDLTAFIDTKEKSGYGDNGTVSQSTSKEEREAGVKTAILGNVRIFFTAGGDKTDAVVDAFDGEVVDDGTNQDLIPF